MSPVVAGLVADGSPAGLIAQLAEVWDAVSTLGRHLAPAQWDLPTMCPGWSVKDQVVHMIGTESMLSGRPTPEVELPSAGLDHVRNDIGRFNEAWVVALADLDGPAVLEQFDEVVAARLAALREMPGAAWDEPGWTPVGNAPYRRFMQIRIFDCWVHLQDMRTALRADPTPPDLTFPDLTAVDGGQAAQQAVDEVVRAIGLLVGKRAGAPDGSRVAITLTGPVRREILVAVGGRASVVDHLDGPASVTLTMGSLRFLQLACGRVPADGPSSGVTITGDAGLGQRIVDHLAFTI